MSNSQTDEAVAAIAIVGMSGRFPGARDLNEFWKNLCNGVESISWFSDEELLNSGVSPDVLSAPNYVRAGTVIDGIELFDASFFGFSPREAEIMDPQYRFFIECAWEALEHAAYNPDSFDGIIGVFGGMGMNSYMLNNLLSNPELVESEGNLQLRILNDKDFLASLTAYKLNLRGPSLTVQTACSTSLIAVSLACQSLLNYQCDIALAGGVAISSQQRLGYLAQEGVYSPDGHCRAFDAKAAGTVGGQGVGIVALKRLDDAIADGDYIHAVITGSATNNDGALKAGYTAPSIDGQSNVVAMAQALAGIAPETITYIETHGTATPLGDPIEVAALTQVFRAGTNKKSFCALGSVKTNIGHLDAAAGIASLLKTVLALKHKQIPPTLHFNSPNPHIDFERSPFYVNSALTEWKTGAHPRRAGVSSFSVGGVNAHLIVEEAVERVTSSAPKPRQLILLSAQSDAALEASTDNLVSFLKQNQDANITDIAYTLQVGRKAFGHRRMLVSGSLDDALTALESRDPKRVLNSTEPSAERPVAFLFPGLGNHYVNMGRDLYEEVPSYREQFDLCAEKLRAHLEYDIRDVVYPKESRPEPPKGLDLRRMVRPEPAAEADKRLNQTVAAQTVMFIVEYALAKTWIHMGISPQALMGYSIGEYVAACLAGIFSLDDSLRLVVERAQMIEGLEEGGMLAVPLSVEDVTALSMKGLSVAAINGPSLTILSGPVSAIDDVESRLARSGVATRRLHTTHAFHSRMMEPIRSEFERLVRSFRPGKPEIGILSSLTGSWLTRQQATDPAYWAAQMCETVRFSDAVKLLWNADDRVMLEIGPGQTLGAWALQHPASAGASRGVVISTLRHSYDRQHDFEFFLNSLGRLWLAGLDVKWEGLYEGERRLRLPLPTYPFQRKRFWIEPRRGDAEKPERVGPLTKKSSIAEWFYAPVWMQAPLPAPDESSSMADDRMRWVVFLDDQGIGQSLVERLGERGREVTTVRVGDRFEQVGQNDFKINTRNADDYSHLLSKAVKAKADPTTVVHLWGVTSEKRNGSGIDSSAQCREVGFDSLILLAQAIGAVSHRGPYRIFAVTSNMQDVLGDESLQPEKATILGPLMTIPREYQDVTCQCIDVLSPGSDRQRERTLRQIIRELEAKDANSVVAYRGNHRWVQSFNRIALEENSDKAALLKEGGVYLITGGLGGIGLSIAERLASELRARLVLTGRSAFPQMEDWAEWLAARGEDDPISRKIKRLQSFERAGAEALVIRADVTDLEDMKRAFRQVKQKYGRIDGVIHAAGVAPGGMIQVKSLESSAAVLAPKVTGTLILSELIENEHADFLVLCSSLSSIVGSFGLVDHCGANAFLDAFSRSRSGAGGTKTISINWDAWLEVGQAADAELSAGLKKLIQAPLAIETGHPLLESLIQDEEGERVFSSRLSTAKHWVMNEHRINGVGVLPGTAYLEMIRAAFRDQMEASDLVIEKVVFLSPLALDDGQDREVRLIATGKPNGYGLQIRSVAGQGPSGETRYQDHVSCQVRVASPEETRRHDIEALQARCNVRKPFYADRGDAAAAITGERNRSFHVGKRWQKLLKDVRAADNEIIAFLDLPEEYSEDLERLGIHPAMMDVATGLLQMLGDGSYLPLAYERVVIKRPFTRRIYSHLKLKDGRFSTSDVIAGDIIIMDEEGYELVRIEEYTVRKVSASALAPRLSRSDSTFNKTPAPVGLLPREGAEVFMKIMTAGPGLSQIAVSTRDLGALMEQASKSTGTQIIEQVERLQASRPRHPRPELSARYEQARTDLERSLVKLWQETLNVEEVGIHDNFFELGGDSLLATQLIARISQSFNVDLSLRSMFEAPTITGLAHAIVHHQAEATNEDLLESALREIRQMSAGDLRQALAAEKAAGDEGASHE